MAVPHPTPAVVRLEDDRLVATLHQLGIRYLLASGPAEPYPDLPPDQLIAALISNEEARIEYAVIPLWLRQSEFADSVPMLAATLPEPEAERLRLHYTAAVYLQRYYQPALEIYLGPTPWLPDYFSTPMGLPSPDDYYGEIGLRELVSRLPPPINWWESYLDPVRMFIRALSLEKTYGWKTD